MHSQHSTAHADPTALFSSLCTSTPFPRAPDEPQHGAAPSSTHPAFQIQLRISSSCSKPITRSSRFAPESGRVSKRQGCKR